jgi:hypothetical protein
MKPIKKILLLMLCVSAIVLLWLVPGINTAKTVRYTRTFEDTDPQPHQSFDSTLLKIQLPTAHAKTLETKRYKKEHISSKASIREIKAEMFSRATHFKEVEEILPIEKVIVEVDSIERTVVKNDSINHTLLDSISGIW